MSRMNYVPGPQRVGDQNGGGRRVRGGKPQREGRSGTRADVLRRRAGLVVAASAMLLLSACTTVTQLGLTSTASRRAEASSGGTAGGQPSGPSSASASTTSTTPASSSPGVTTGTAGSTGSAHAAAASTGSTAAAGTTCTTPVKIGVSYSSDLAGGLASVGTSSGSTASYFEQEQGVFDAIANNINAHGGLAGCPIQVVFHDFLALAADGFSGESQSECVDFAEDQHVFAVIPTTLENKTLVACLAQHGVVTLFDSDEYAIPAADFETYRGYLYQPDAINVDRWGPYITELAHMGWLASGDKVGILEADDGSGSAADLVNNVWVPALKALGFDPVVFTYTEIEGYSDVTSATDQMNSAVLQFKQDGVNRIILPPDGADAVVFFTQLAASQGYEPEYAENNLSGDQEWSTVPASEQPGAVDVSYSLANTLSSTGPQPAPSAARTACADVLSKYTSSQNGPSAYYVFCDDFNFLQAALAGASAVNPSTLLAGAEKLGCSLQMADLYDNACISPGHYDGANEVQGLQWSVSQNNWEPVGTPVSIP